MHRPKSKLKQPTRFNSETMEEDNDNGDSAGRLNGFSIVPAAIEETPKFRTQLREPSPNKFKQLSSGRQLIGDGDDDRENVDMASSSNSSDKQFFASVKRKLDYSSPLKDKRVLEHMQRGPSLDM